MGAQTQITLASSRGKSSAGESFLDVNSNDISRAAAEEEEDDQEAINALASNNIIYSISTWALIDEATLSSNVVSQFECLLLIDGTNYEQRQSLALQRGK